MLTSSNHLASLGTNTSVLNTWTNKKEKHEYTEQKNENTKRENETV